jgi:ferrous iron transport protein A
MTPRELVCFEPGEIDGENGRNLMPLTESGKGVRVRAVGLTGGGGLARRLTDMGLYRGATVDVLSGGRHGPVIIRLGSSRLALGRGMAHKILVELVV